MDLAKVPDKNKKWEALDIFLFSNGLPQQAPPRKYHLTVDDLINWDSTLRTLAHSQYDNPQSTIRIYTVDGQKVLSPTEITNENTYVAVLSQDKFIPAGYTEYLLKASRSREKRLSKVNKTNNISQGFNASKLAPKDETTNKKLSIDAGNNNSSLSDQPASGPQRPSNTRYSNLGKTLDKRLNNNSTVLRKNNYCVPNNITPRTSLKSRENLSRKNFKVNTGKTVSNEQNTIISNSNTLKPKSKLFSKTGLDSTILDTHKKPDEINNLSLIIDDLLANEKKCLTDSSQIQNIIDDKELIVVKNIESIVLTADKSPPTYYGQQTLLSSVIPVIVEENKTINPNKEDANVTVINNYVENIFNPDVAVNNDVLTTHEDTIKMDNISMSPDQNLKNNDMDLNIANPDNNFISIIQKDDVIKLNLRIEIRNAAGMVSAQYVNDINKYQSLAEKSSQVVINEICVQSIDKKSQGTAKITRTNEIPNTTLHCGCTNNNLNEILNEINTSVDFGGKRVFILADPDYLKRWPRCNCGQDTVTIAPKEQNQSIDTRSNEVLADTKILEKAEKNTSLIQKQDIVVTSSQMQSSSKTITDIDDKKGVEIDNELLVREVNLSRQQIVPHSSLIVRKNGSSTIKRFVDISTQTEWASLLLEARLHEDGRYSFHLPPLQVLKQYKM